MQQFSNLTSQAQIGTIDFRDVMRRVYLWVALGLLVGFGTATVFAQIANQQLQAGNPILLSRTVSLIAIVAYLGVGLTFNVVVQRSSIAVGTAMYFLFTAIFGFMISSIFLVYTTSSITTTLVVTAAMFGLMAILGYTTNIDLSKVGSIAYMALIGVIVASIANFFLHNATIYWVITYAGILLFCALTAYDVQSIKRRAIMATRNGGTMEVSRLALIGAFALFLDFVNLFLFLLRIFGRSR